MQLYIIYPIDAGGNEAARERGQAKIGILNLAFASSVPSILDTTYYYYYNLYCT